MTYDAATQAQPVMLDGEELKIGDDVVIARQPENPENDALWAGAMSRFVGRRGVVDRHSDNPSTDIRNFGEPVVCIDIDGAPWWFRLSELERVHTYHHATQPADTPTEFPNLVHTNETTGPGLLHPAFRDSYNPYYPYNPSWLVNEQRLCPYDDLHGTLSLRPGYDAHLTQVEFDRAQKARRARFAEWRDDPAHYADGKWTHVIEPFDIPNTWRVYRSFDFGYAKPFSVGWWAVDFDGRLYRILELYGCVPGEPDTGVRWTPEQIFEQIRTTEATHPYLRGRDIRGVADPAIWDASRGDSIADIADRYGVYFEPGDHKRLPGWMQVHYRLAFDAAGLPMLYVFRNCRDTRRTLPLLRYDAHAPEDVDTRQEDHIADEIRYLCQSDPIAPRPVVQRTPKVFDPLSSD